MGQGLPTNKIKKIMSQVRLENWALIWATVFFFLSIFLALEESLLSNGGMGLIFIGSKCEFLLIFHFLCLTWLMVFFFSQSNVFQYVKRKDKKLFPMEYGRKNLTGCGTVSGTVGCSLNYVNRIN